MAEIDPAITQSVAEDNLKNIAGSAANGQAHLNSVIAFTQANAMQMINASMQEYLASIGRRNNMADIAMAQAMTRMQEMDPQQALALSKSMSSDTPTMLAQLLAALGSGQQVAKVAETTPPVTSNAPAGIAG